MCKNLLIINSYEKLADINSLKLMNEILLDFGLYLILGCFIKLNFTNLEVEF